ncbi:hypothetical protein [Bacillus thuringiensis]|uniref:hypothetical protein n=1 Tax=Bacillus thuringiensis TaxID=1428 RepID=UPI0021B17206|nr:hypothetical protein [Bacillus thuringiensis]
MFQSFVEFSKDMCIILGGTIATSALVALIFFLGSFIVRTVLNFRYDRKQKRQLNMIQATRPSNLINFNEYKKRKTLKKMA